MNGIERDVIAIREVKTLQPSRVFGEREDADVGQLVHPDEIESAQTLQSCKLEYRHVR
jgi:hypothetical protein